MQDTDIEFIRARYARARDKYRPRTITTLMVAEAPPHNLERYFYYEAVPRQDSLFLEIMGVLYPDEKAAYLQSGRDPFLKAELLQAFAEDGFWLINLLEIPSNLAPYDLKAEVPGLVKRIEGYIDKDTPIILIKATLWDLCAQPLQQAGFRLIGGRMPHPGSGQQLVFRQKFRQALEER